MSEWHTVCKETDIAPNSGVCAKVGDVQVAIFISQRTNEAFAISNYDPIAKANVLSRGIIASRGDGLYVASPIYKEHWHLATGHCLEHPHLSIPTFPLKRDHGWIQIQA